MRNKLTFTIDGSVWTVKRVRNLRAKSEKLMGYMDPSTNTISIDAALSEEVMMETIGHEIVHVWFEQTGLRGFLSEEQQEGLCDAIGRKLMAFVRENTGE